MNISPDAVIGQNSIALCLACSFPALIVIATLSILFGRHYFARWRGLRLQKRLEAAKQKSMRMQAVIDRESRRARAAEDLADFEAAVRRMRDKAPGPPGFWS